MLGRLISHLQCCCFHPFSRVECTWQTPCALQVALYSTLELNARVMQYAGSFVIMCLLLF